VIDVVTAPSAPAIPEIVEPSIWPVPVNEPSGPALPAIEQEWRLERLAARYALPALCAEKDELAALSAAGLAGSAYVACAVVCVLRSTLGGMLLPHGPWIASMLLAWSGAAHLESAAGDDAPAGEWFLHAAQDGGLEPPLLLAPFLFDDDALRVLRSELEGWEVSVEPVAGGGQRLAARHRDQETAVLDLFPSRLLHALLLAQSGVERATGRWIDPQTGPITDAAAQALVGSAWLALVPEVPVLRAPQPNPEPGASGLAAAWLRHMGKEPELPLRLGLTLRAHLVWTLAVLTAQVPHAGWTALLALAPPDHYRILASAAYQAGVSLLPPDLARSAVEWRPDDDLPESPPRCGLAAVCGVDLARTLVDERERGGAFSSLGDLLERVPTLRLHPTILARLLASGACDAWQPRASLLRIWQCLAASLQHADRATEVLPDPDVPISPADADRACVWTHALFPLAPLWSAAPPARLGATALPSTASWSAGVTLQIGGVVVAHRSIDLAGRGPAQVVELSDATERVTVVLPADTAIVTTPVQYGAWLETTVIGAPGTQPLWLAAALIAAPGAGMVTVLLPRLGEREAELRRLVTLHRILADHPGSYQVTFVLVHNGMRRRLDLGEVAGVCWSPSLREAIEALLGPDSVELRDAVG
jgi:hypothetical protein